MSPSRGAKKQALSLPFLAAAVPTIVVGLLLSMALLAWESQRRRLAGTSSSVSVPLTTPPPSVKVRSLAESMRQQQQSLQRQQQNQGEQLEASQIEDPMLALAQVLRCTVAPTGNLVAAANLPVCGKTITRTTMTATSTSATSTSTSSTTVSTSSSTTVSSTVTSLTTTTTSTTASTTLTTISSTFTTFTTTSTSSSSTSSSTTTGTTTTSTTSATHTTITATSTSFTSTSSSSTTSQTSSTTTTTSTSNTATSTTSTTTTSSSSTTSATTLSSTTSSSTSSTSLSSTSSTTASSTSTTLTITSTSSTTSTTSSTATTISMTSSTITATSSSTTNSSTSMTTSSTSSRTTTSSTSTSTTTSTSTSTTTVTTKLGASSTTTSTTTTKTTTLTTTSTKTITKTTTKTSTSTKKTNSQTTTTSTSTSSTTTSTSTSTSTTSATSSSSTTTTVTTSSTSSTTATTTSTSTITSTTTSTSTSTSTTTSSASTTSSTSSSSTTTSTTSCTSTTTTTSSTTTSSTVTSSSTSSSTTTWTTSTTTSSSTSATSSTTTSTISTSTTSTTSTTSSSTSTTTMSTTTTTTSTSSTTSSATTTTTSSTSTSSTTKTSSTTTTMTTTITTTSATTTSTSSSTTTRTSSTTVTTTSMTTSATTMTSKTSVTRTITTTTMGYGQIKTFTDTTITVTRTKTTTTGYACLPACPSSYYLGCDEPIPAGGSCRPQLIDQPCMQRSSQPLTFFCPLVNPDHARRADVDGTLPTTDCAVCGISSQLTDNDPRAGHIRGTITFGPAVYSTSNTTGVTEYRLYFVDAAGERLGPPVAVVPEAQSMVMTSECCMSSLHTVHVQTALPVLPPGQDTLRIAIVPVVGDLELPLGSATSPVQDLIGSHVVDPQAYTTTTAMTTRPPLVAFAGELVVETASVRGLMSDQAAWAAIGRGLSRAAGLRSASVQFLSFAGQPNANLASFSYRLLVKDAHEVGSAASILSDLSADELQAFVGIELEAIGKESYAVVVISNHEAMTITTTGTVPPNLPQVDEKGALANVGIIVIACLVFVGCCCILLTACTLQSALHHSAKAASQQKVLPIQPTDVVGLPENNSPDNQKITTAIWVPQMGQLPEETLQLPSSPKYSTQLPLADVQVRKNGDENDLRMPEDVPQQQQQHEGPKAIGRPQPIPSPWLRQKMHDEHKEFFDSPEATLHRPASPTLQASPPTWAPVSLTGGSGDQGIFAEEDWPDSTGAGRSGPFGVVPFASTLQLDEELRTRHRGSCRAGSGLGASGGTMSTTATTNGSMVSSPARPLVSRTSQRCESPDVASIFTCSGSLASAVSGVPGHQPFRQSTQPHGIYDIHELAELKQIPGSMNTNGGWRCREHKLQLRRPASAASTLQHQHRPTSATSSQGHSQGVSRQAGRLKRPTSAAGTLTIGGSLLRRDGDQNNGRFESWGFSDGGGGERSNDRASPQPWLPSRPVSRASGRPSTVVEGCDDWSVERE